MNEDTSAIVVAVVGGTVGLLLGRLVTWQRYRELRGWWRRKRDGVRKADVIAAIEAAALAQDLRLAWSLSGRYRLERCSNCVQRPVRHGRLRWALPRTDDYQLIHGRIGLELGHVGIPEVSARDERFDTVGVCDGCWLNGKPPEGWFHASIVR